MGNRIFISYRREDRAGSAGRIYDQLAAHFGPDNIFMDVDDIDPGLDFVEVIENAISQSNALVVIIGPAWLDAGDTDGKRRLDHPDDFVRIEITAALKRNIRVIPALVGRATMPDPNDLPDDLKSLARRNGIIISHTSFRSDVDRLIDVLDKAIKQAETDTTAEEKESDTIAGDRAHTSKDQTSQKDTQKVPDKKEKSVVQPKVSSMKRLMLGTASAAVIFAVLYAAVMFFLSTPNRISNWISGAKSPQEKQISMIQGIAIKKALCLPAGVRFGPNTRAAIKMYKEFLGVMGADQEKDGVLRVKAQIAVLSAMTSCDRAVLGEKNIYERMLFGNDPELIEYMQEQIDAHLAVLIATGDLHVGRTITNNDLIAQASDGSRKLDKRTRDAITILQYVAGGGNIPKGMIEGQVTQQFLEILFGWIEEPPSNYSKKFHHFFPRGDMIGYYKNRVSLVQCPGEAGFDSCAIGNTLFQNMGSDNGRIVWAHPNRVIGVAGSVLVCKRNGVEFKFEVPEKDEFGDCP